MAKEIYDKYRQFDDKANGAREIFKRMILEHGTEMCLVAAKTSENLDCLAV